jgi:hypothetical protein
MLLGHLFLLEKVAEVLFARLHVLIKEGEISVVELLMKEHSLSVDGVGEKVVMVACDLKDFNADEESAVDCTRAET